MIGFKVVNLDLLLQVKSEEQIRTILNDFESPLNPDIESFLKYKAVEFSKSAIAKTYLVMASYQGANKIASTRLWQKAATPVWKNLRINWLTT